MNKRKKFTSLLALIMAMVLLLSLLLSLLGSVANAASSSEIQDQIDELEDQKEATDRELAELEELLSENLDSMLAMIAQKDAIDQQIAILQSQNQTISQMVSAYNLMIADQQEALDKAEARMEELNEKYKLRIRAMEEQGGLSYWSVIFNASSFSDLLDRLNMVAEIANADAKRLEELKEVAQEVEAARADLFVKKQELDVVKQELQASQTEMEAKRAEADGILADLVALGEEYEIYMEEAEDRQQQLMEELAAKEDEYDEAVYQEWLATSVPPTTTAPPGGGSNTVDGITWITPTKNYRITDRFGMRWHPISGQYKMHNGIDMAAPQGTPIYATRSGYVTLTSFQAGGAGYYVKINHGDGFSSIYMHMTHYIVSAGEYVSAGQVIGYVGNTGGSTGPHLHFGISYNGTYVDPELYIDV